MSTEKSSRFLSIGELAHLARLSISTIHRYMKAGKLPFIQLGGPRSRVLFRADVLEHFESQPHALQSRSEESAASTSSESARHDAVPNQIPGPRPKWLSGPNIKPR
jgi:excisionase family DNA binding protein